GSMLLAESSGLGLAWRRIAITLILKKANSRTLVTHETCRGSKMDGYFLDLWLTNFPPSRPSFVESWKRRALRACLRWTRSAGHTQSLSVLSLTVRSFTLQSTTSQNE